MPSLHMLTWTALCRQGSSDELALLVADFGLLDGQLAQMCDAIDQGHPSDIDGDDLDRMAVEVPDLRARLGIGSAPVGSCLLHCPACPNTSPALDSPLVLPTLSQYESCMRCRHGVQSCELCPCQACAAVHL